MLEPLKTFLRFENLVKELLIENGFQVRAPQPVSRDAGYDFEAERDGEKWAIEVKYYRTARPQLSLIEAAAIRLANNIPPSSKTKGMLVVACSLSQEQRQALENKLGVILTDRSDLFAWAYNSPEKADELTSILEERFPPNELQKGRNINQSVTAKAPPPRPKPADTKGTDLCKELRSLKCGKETWSQYEKLCDRILRYLFPNDLHGWHTQKRTDDGLNRFDYICRIRPTTDFWTFILNHLNSRYILFEFKNYRSPIKQGQILTTEKYLLEKGLRRVAIILSRAGAEKSATAMTQGAMRENGKLMLILDDEKVCQMLHMKERGEDPTDLLFEITDNFLLSLPR